MSVVSPVRSTSYVGNNSSPPVSDFNSTGSDDGYREKFVNLKFLVKEQQKQLESKRVQCEALKSIQESLAEERRENSELIENNKKLQRMVALLHDRLVENGLSTRTEFDAIDAQVPPSTQLLENLIEENKKLQKKLEYLKVDPAKMEQLYKEKLAYEQELQKKNQTIEKLTAENQQLLYKSTDEKDAKIVELQGEVDRLRQSQDTQDVICQSLSEETITLKERLRKTAEVCQHLVRQLEQMSVEKQEPDTLGLSLDRMTMSTSDENLVAENERLQLECINKDEEIVKLTEMNTRWQVYNDERNNQMALQQRELEETKRMMELLRQQLSGKDQVQKELQHRAAVAEEVRQQAVSENRQLRNTMEHLEQQQRHQTDTISSLRQQVQALADANVSQAAPCGHDDTQIVHMEAQLKVYQEDFESERRDRELAQTKISELENELSLVKRQLDQFQGEYMQRLQHQRQTALSNYGNAFREGSQPVGCHHPMVARGVYQCDAPGNVEEDGEGEDEIDGPCATTNPPPAEETIQCPSCKKEFPRSRHDALLEHIDECCD